MEASVGGDDLEKRGASGRNKEGRRGRRAESALGGGPTSKLCVNLLHEEGEPFHVAVVCSSVQSRTSREDLVRGGRREGGRKMCGLIWGAAGKKQGGVRAGIACDVICGRQKDRKQREPHSFDGHAHAEGAHDGMGALNRRRRRRLRSGRLHDCYLFSQYIGN